MSHQSMRSKSNRRRVRRGFTLLEVLLVLVILGVIAALVVPQLTGTQQRSLIMATKVKISDVEKTVNMYAIDHNATFPPTLNDLVSPMDLNNQPMAPYVKELPLDAWQHPINYEPPTGAGAGGASPRIWSNGPNGQNESGSGDDINNWTTTTASK
jgi:general secretion pathway protein G